MGWKKKKKKSANSKLFSQKENKEKKGRGGVLIISAILLDSYFPHPSKRRPEWSANLLASEQAVRPLLQIFNDSVGRGGSRRGYGGGADQRADQDGGGTMIYV